jgi:3-oxoacyl-[acyl-carrier-protein] synthase-3
VLVSRDPEKNRVVDCYQVTKGYYWDAATLQNELVASYFPTARAVILDALRRANLAISDIDWIVPHNVSLRSWQILLGALGLPMEKLYAENIATKGHTIAADNLLNLKDMEDAGLLQRGQRLLLFSFGFGANWSTLILER